jgi:hypothetical protein
MDFLYAFLGGLSAKFYDDLISDNKIIKSEIIGEILKGIQWIILTLISVNDFNFTSIMYSVNVANHFGNSKAYTEPYEKALLILYPILLIFSFSTRVSIPYMDILLLIISIICMCLEPIVSKNEVSFKKLVLRIFISISLICIIFLSSYFDISKSIIKLLYYALGYLGFSSLFQFYCLFIKDLTGTLKKKVESVVEPSVEMRPEIAKEVTEEIKEEDAMRV